MWVAITSSFLFSEPDFKGVFIAAGLSNPSLLITLLCTTPNAPLPSCFSFVTSLESNNRLSSRSRKHYKIEHVNLANNCLPKEKLVSQDQSLLIHYMNYFFSCGSLYTRLNSHYKACSYKKKTEMEKRYTKND